MCAFSPRATFAVSEPIHDAILFVSAADKLTQGSGGHLAAPAFGGSPPVAQLWAVSPDGRRAGRLTNDAGGAGVYVSPGEFPTVIILSTNQLLLDDKRVRQIPLPPECDSPAGTPAGEPWLPCRDYKFSPDGRWAAFSWGPDVCGRRLALKNLLTGQAQIDPGGLKRGIHWFRFLPNGQMLVATGHCEGGAVSLLDLDAQALRQLGVEGGGGEGGLIWNAGGTAFAVSTSDYPGWTWAVWGYNVATGRLFLHEEWQVNDQPLWMPDGVRLLYQHRAQKNIESGRPGIVVSTTFGASEIRVVDAMSGQERVLVSDPRYDYHLGAAFRDCRWEGDWVQVRRVPFHPQEYPSPDLPPRVWDCLLLGDKCSDPVDRLALNWRTGELLPWDKVPLPTPTPRATPTVTPGPGPHLSPAPLYRDPLGRYNLYTEQDGRSLWCVTTATGAAVRWVADGQHFMYIR